MDDTTVRALSNCNISLYIRSRSMDLVIDGVLYLPKIFSTFSQPSSNHRYIDQILDFSTDSSSPSPSLSIPARTTALKKAKNLARLIASQKQKKLARII